MSRLKLSGRERAALAKLAETPRAFGDVNTDHMRVLLDYGLAQSALGHYVITARGQLELQRQNFRSLTGGRAAKVSESQLSFLHGAESGQRARPSLLSWLRGILTADGEAVARERPTAAAPGDAPRRGTRRIPRGPEPGRAPAVPPAGHIAN